MRIVKQGSWTTNVRRIDENKIKIDVTLLASDFEGSVYLLCKCSDFEILDAGWAIFRAPDPERRGEGKAPMLIGESAFVKDRRNSIKILPDYSMCVDYIVPPGGWMGQENHKSQVLDQPPEEVSPEWEEIRELYLEALRGVLLSENFLIVERGIGTLEQSEINWLASSPACRPYNIRMPEVDEWPTYTGITHEYRNYDLYNKYLHAIYWENEDGTVAGFGTYHDSFHEITARITYGNSDGIIKRIEIAKVRVPFEHCYDIDESFAEPLIGKSIYDITKMDVGSALGGRLGCFHLVDIVADMIHLIQKKA